MGLNVFKRGQSQESPEEREARLKADKEIAELRQKERVDLHAARVARAREEITQRAQRKVAYEARYDAHRAQAALGKADVKAAKDAAEVGLAPGTRLLRRAGGALQKISDATSGPAPRGPRGSRKVLVKIGDNTYEERTVPAPGKAGPAPRRARPVIPAFQGGGGVPAARFPGLSEGAPNIPAFAQAPRPQPAKKRKGTGIAILDSPLG